MLGHTNLTMTINEVIEEVSPANTAKNVDTDEKLASPTSPAKEVDTDEKLASPTSPEDVQRLNESRGVLAETHDHNMDYDERATKFWSVYVEEAGSYDKALIETWKEDMEGIIIFVRPPLALRPDW